MNKLIALYCRTSGSRQEHGITAQSEALVAYAKRKNLSYKLYIDEDCTGKNSNRPEFEKMKQAIRLGKVEMVVSYSLSRIFRNLSDMLKLNEFFQTHSCNFTSIIENIETGTPTGRLIFHILSSVAEFESSIASERTTAALASAKAKGVILGRKKNPISLETKTKIIELSQIKLPVRSIAKVVNIPSSTVHRIIKEIRNEVKIS